MSRKPRRKMEVKKIFIPISQLATYINENPYGNLSQILSGLWMKVDFNSYSQKLVQLEQKTGRCFKALTEWELMMELCDFFGLDLKERIKDSMKNSESRGDLKRNQRALIRDVNQISVQTAEDQEKKTKLCSLITSFTNRGYGTQHEDSAVDLYSKQTGAVVSDQQKKVVKKIVTSQSPPVEWNLIGKIDGLATFKDGSQKIVEIKNRTTRLFGVLKGYEKPQIQSYLKLTGHNEGHLVESLNIDKAKTPYGRQREIKIIPVTYEPEYWNFLKTRMAGFVNFFGDFLKNDQLQDLVLMGPNQQGEELLKGLLGTYF